jgi:cytochrome c oxidase subunit 2
MVRKLMLIGLMGLMRSIWALPAMNMPKGVTPISHQLYHLHMVIFFVCTVIALGVFAAMFYIMLRYRKSVGAKSANFHHSTVTEIIWTLIPTLILIVMAIPSTRVLIDMNDDRKADVNIKITGHQWHWEYAYLDHGIKFSSNLATPRSQIDNKTPKGPWYLLEVDEPLVLPIHKKIRFLVTSTDVNHSWWVPEFGVKKDALPGLINTAWAKIDRPGIYRGQCTELCGMQHGYMPIVVIALTEEQFNQWIKEKKAGHATLPTPDLTAPAIPLAPATLMAEGKKVYTHTCAVCHQENGEGMPPAFPSIKGSKIATGPVDDHVRIVLYGKHGTAMQAFESQLTDREIASVTTYQRNSWDNQKQSSTGNIQPAEVARIRQEGDLS